MLHQILIAAAAAAGLLLLLWELRGWMLTPVKPGKHLHLRIEITVSGSAPELEQTVDALMWLRANGTLRAELLLRDRGMDKETAEIAAALEARGMLRIID